MNKVDSATLNTKDVEAKNVSTSATQRLTAVFENRVRYALRNATPSLLIWVTSIMLLFGLAGFFIPLTAVVVAFFGVVESLRLLRPQWYPFTFDKQLLLGLRLGTVTYLLLGVIGIILNWSEIYGFLKPVFDWINA